jgi:hypothetical protein
MGNFTTQSFDKAIKLVQSGATIREALICLDISRTNFYRNITDEQKQFIRQTKINYTNDHR